MRTLDFLTAFCFLLGLIDVCFTKRGFILTAPKVIDAGSREYFTLTVFDVPQGGEVTLKLLHKPTDIVLSESKVSVLNNINTWVELDVPPLSSDVEAKLQIQGSFSDGYKIDALKDVRIRHNSILTFIQTDKPLYKPGQTVRFRVLPMDSQLKPLGEDTVGDLWIEDPSSIRVAQWRDVKFTEGMKQFELPLSEEPPLGTWNIKTIINKVSTAQNFNVEKYVLPKFEVVIKPPDYIMADAETISTEICARYTYGKKVEGTLKAKITYQRLSWEVGRPIPSVEHMGQLSGCHQFIVNSQDLLFQSNEFGYRTLEIFAEVTENGTEIVRNATTTIGITHSPLHLKFLGSESNKDYFKPHIPFYGKLEVTKPDGTAAASEKIEICALFGSSDNQRCHTFTSNKNGMIRFSVSPQPSSIAKIYLKAEAINYEPLKYSEDAWRAMIVRPRADMELTAWYSPSDSYLQIESVTGELECEKLQRVKVRYAAMRGTTIKFYHQVLSRGRIVQQGSHQRTFYPTGEEERRYDLGDFPSSQTELTTMNSTTETELGEFILSFDPRATMSPIARLLVFFVLDDGEVVADSRIFRIAKCLLNKVSLHFRHEQQYPSTEAAILLSASPSSVCGIGMVDKSVRLLRKDTQFDKNKLFKLMESYDVGKKDHPRQVNEDYCVQKFISDAFWKSRDDSDMYSPLGFSRSFSTHADTSMAFEEAGMVVVTDLILETRPCFHNYVVPLAYTNLARTVPDGNGVPIELMRGERLAFGSDFLRPLPTSPGIPPAKDKENPPKSTEEIRSYFPETWLWEMHTVGPSGETALKRQLPHTITEWTGGAVCVHPKTGLGISEASSITAFQPFFISFQLPYSVVRGEVLPLVINTFNYLSECLPIKLSLEPSEEYKILSENRFHKACVCGGESESSRFLMKPLKLGIVNITVYGFSLEDDDEVCGNEITARLSARDAVTKQLIVEAEGFPKEEVFNYFVCPENTNGSYASEVDLLLPEDVIPGSARATMSVSGDLMGPALNGIKNLVRQPVGCGEQNMVLFVPNIFVLDYLIGTGKITDEIKEECITHMKTGYQRELQYRHKDGSYSAFGAGDLEGSLWLTAFVLKSFGQARRFIEVDEHELMRSTSWILGKQFENGCFEASGFLLNKAMKGGLSDGEHSLAPLTAYILIALLESQTVRTDDPAVKNAFKCLEADTNPSSYGLALFAYASALAEKRPSKFLSLLEERAIKKGNQMYWEIQGRGGKSRSISVEIAGYYILARSQASLSESIDALPVVRWIISRRNSNGGFVSTQDTVVALQALAKYASLQSNKPIDIGLVVESDELVRGFKMDGNNKLLTQSVAIPILPSVVDLQAVGEGCSLVQFSLRYNVEKVSGSDAFDLNIDVLRLGSSDCNLPRIGICMRYKITDQASNMVVLSVKMASGFRPDEWSLYKLQADPGVQLKRHEVNGNEVNLYFNELTNDQKCFKFFIKSEIEVEDVKPALIKLYDYYQPELEITKEYVIPSSCTVSSLPELPRLPPLIDTDDDETLGILLSKVTQSQTEGNSSEIEPTLETATVTVDTITGATATLDSVDGVELSDEARQPESDNDSTHLQYFIDVIHDLDFPDGIEGNVPVTVSYTGQFKTTESEVSDCPTCEDDFPENFTQIYCNSAFVLRVTVRDGQTGMVKLLQDLSPYIPQPQAIKKFAKVKYNQDCSCPQIHEKSKILLLIGSPITLWNSQEEKHFIELTGGVHVISSPSRAVQPNQLRKARSLCEDDP